MRYRRLGRTALQVSELCLGTMNFGPQTPEDESFAIMDRALELGINFFDTANRLRRRQGRRRHRVDHRTVVRPGRRPAGQDRPGDQALRSDGRLAERRPALGPPHPEGVRGQPPPAADRPHRPLPDAPHRPDRALGRDLAGDGHARPAGQDHLRRQQQLRRMAHRPGERDRRRAATPSASSASRASTTSWCGPSNSRCSRPAATTASA